MLWKLTLVNKVHGNGVDVSYSFLVDVGINVPGVDSSLDEGLGWRFVIWLNQRQSRVIKAAMNSCPCVWQEKGNTKVSF
eukprot:2642456-Amphidinium_carterae.2